MSRNDGPWPPEDAEPVTLHPKAPQPGTKLNAHYEECFGCSEHQPGGLRIRSMVTDDYRVQSTCTISSSHQGAPGLAHGGLLTAVFDESLGAAVGHLLLIPSVTGKLETTFQKPVPVGSTLVVVSSVDGIAGRKVYASSQARLEEDGPVVASAKAVFIKVDVEHFAKHGDADAVEKLLDASKGRYDGPRWQVNP